MSTSNAISPSDFRLCVPTELIPKLQKFLNPAIAKIKLDISEVWWIVTTTNPLKKNKVDYKKRLKKVKRFLMNHHIKVLEIQDLSKNTYTVDLLEFLFYIFPHN